MYMSVSGHLYLMMVLDRHLLPSKTGLLRPYGHKYLIWVPKKITIPWQPALLAWPSPAGSSLGVAA